MNHYQWYHRRPSAVSEIQAGLGWTDDTPWSSEWLLGGWADLRVGWGMEHLTSQMKCSRQNGIRRWNETRSARTRHHLNSLNSGMNQHSASRLQTTVWAAPRHPGGMETKTPRKPIYLQLQKKFGSFICRIYCLQILVVSSPLRRRLWCL